MLGKKDIRKYSYLLADKFPYVVVYRGPHMEEPENVVAEDLAECLEKYEKHKAWCEEVAMFKIEDGIPYALRMKEVPA